MPWIYFQPHAYYLTYRMDGIYMLFDSPRAVTYGWTASLSSPLCMVHWNRLLLYNSNNNCCIYYMFFDVYNKLQWFIELKPAFGQVIVKLRREKRFSQEALAERCHIDRVFLSMIENGKSQPTLTTIFLLSKGLGIAPSRLMAKVSQLTTKIGEEEF